MPDSRAGGRLRLSVEHTQSVTADIEGSQIKDVIKLAGTMRIDLRRVSKAASLRMTAVPIKDNAYVSRYRTDKRLRKQPLS